MSQSLASFNPGSISSNQHGGRICIYDISFTVWQQLCNHIDELNAWEELANVISLPPEDIQKIRRHKIMGNSPTDELKIWGGQYAHNATELFCALKIGKLYHAMQMLKDFVEREYHMLIPNRQPVLSILLAQDKTKANNAQSKKILNVNTSFGVSDSNMTRDDNYSSSVYSSNSDSLTSGSNQSFNNLREIKYHELADATNNWSEYCILGKGGFGTVFKGNWKHTDFAIKQINYRTPDGLESVKVQLQQSINELKYLNSCRHDNVLPLYGYSIKGDKPCLVYQLMAGGSLEQRLYSEKFTPLTLPQRINICLGTARGINYLHTFRDKPLIHGDIKPANVLLDQHLQPKIGDFGLAREGPNAINSAVEVTQIFGTKPYLPPEFLNYRKLSTQVDTYSFGVVLLETFTGLRAYEKNRSNQFLTKHMKLCAAVNWKLEDFIDQRIPLQLPGEGEMCRRILMLGLECIADSLQYRPDMERVLKQIDTTEIATRSAQNIGDICSSIYRLESGTDIVMAVVYISPNKRMTDIIAFLKNALAEYNEEIAKLIGHERYKLPLILSGDFNVNFSTEESKILKDVLRDFLKLNMNNDPTQATTKSGTTIDAVFSRFLDKIESQTFVSYFSYHKPIISFVEHPSLENSTVITEVSEE